MDQGKLKAHLAGSKEATRAARDRIEALEARRNELGPQIDAARAEYRRTVSYDNVEGLLATAEGMSEAEALLFRTLIENGFYSQSGESGPDRLESFNDTLEEWRSLLSVGPHLVVGNYPNKDYPDRKLQIVLAGRGDMLSPEVARDETGIYFVDENGSRIYIMEQLQGTTGLRPSSSFSLLHAARANPTQSMRVFSGYQDIVEFAEFAKNTDLTAFFVALRQTSGFVDYPESVLALPAETVEQVTGAVAQCIAATSLKHASSESLSESALRQLLGDVAVDKEYQPYLQLAEYYIENPDFYEAMGKIFGDAFSREALLSRAYKIQQEHLARVLRVRTPLGNVAVRVDKKLWPNGVRHINVPKPTVKHGGLS